MKKQFTLLKTAVTIFVIGLLMSSNLFAQKQLWGVTMQGGTNDAGCIFKTDSICGNQSVVYSFAQATGITPEGSLIQANDGYLYGMTQYGGVNSMGVLFKFNPVTYVYTKLIDFAGISNGADPDGSLLQASDGNLYGMTEKGGTNDLGVLFKYNLQTSTFTKLVDFAGATNGGCPMGALIQATDGKLYGLTWKGGTTDYGTLFQYTIATNTLTKKLDFTGTATGDFPYGSLMQATDGKLYGMTYHGGNYDYGVLFNFNTATSVFTKLRDFDNDQMGNDPKGSLIQATNGFLYGMTFAGGNSSMGAIFKWDLNLVAYTKLFNFDAATNGSYPFGSFMQASDGNMYGMTSLGGTNSKGILFQFNPTTSAFTKKLDFTIANGSTPEFTNLIEIDITHFGIREQSEKANFTIYPNPNNGQFTLQFSDASPAQLNSKIEIYNTLGQKMYSTTIKNQIPSTIDISNLLKGIYFVRYADKENNFSEKIVIE